MNKDAIRAMLWYLGYSLPLAVVLLAPVIPLWAALMAGLYGVLYSTITVLLIVRKRRTRSESVPD